MNLAMEIDYSWMLKPKNHQPPKTKKDSSFKGLAGNEVTDDSMLDNTQEAEENVWIRQTSSIRQVDKSKPRKQKLEALQLDVCSLVSDDTSMLVTDEESSDKDMSGKV